MRNLRRWKGAITATGLVVLLSLSIPIFASPLVSGATPNPSAAPEQWAYQGSHWANASSSTLFGQYQVSAFFGWTLVYTLTNTSNSTFTLEAQRTMALHYDAQLCAPTCAKATNTANLTLAGEERETGFANFTTNATVEENGSLAPALGLVNTQSAAQSSLNESVTGTRTMAGVTRSGSASFSVSGTAHSQASFAPALGLIPWQIAPGLGWNSSATFSASGGFSLQYAWDLVGPNGSLNGSGSPSGQLNHSGTVRLMGMDFGNLTLANGQTTNVIGLAWVAGPFDGVDGIILVPHGFGIFASGPHPWGANAPGVQTVVTSRIDIVRDVLHHRIQIAAAASTYAGSDSLSGSASGSSTLSPAAAGPSSPSTVQAQPVSVPVAQSTSACLLGQCGGSASSSLRPLSGALVVGLVAVAVIGTFGVIEYRVWARRRSSTPLVGGYASQVPPPVAPGAPMPPSDPPQGPRSPPRSS
jgi:hypothetical protein